MKRQRTNAVITWRTEHYCLVCGEPGKNTGSCGHPLCLAILTLHPEIKDGVNVHRCTSTVPSDLRATQASLRALSQYRERAMQQVESNVDSTPSGPNDAVHEMETHPDHRWEGDQAESPWSSVSPKFCLFHRQSKAEDEIGLELHRPKRGNVRNQIAKRLGGRQYIEEYDYILAWRCGCPQKTTALYGGIDDLPIRPGRYGICPKCNAAALRIVED